VARLTDLIRGQTDQDSSGPDVKIATRIHDQPHSALSSSSSSPAIAETDWHRSACQELQEIKRAVRVGQRWSPDQLATIAVGIVASLEADDRLVQKALQRGSGDYLVDNAVTVSIVSVKIAHALGYEPQKREQVALAGLLHDVGMFTLPDSVVYKPDRITNEELEMVRQHPEQGVRLLREAGGGNSWLERVILQEHERWDGSGYPHRLAGNQIDEIALIIGMADVFDALMSVRPHRAGSSPHRAIREVLVNGKTQFPYHLLKALVDQLAIYPLGTTVRLSTGEVGVVFQLNRQYPLRPILHVMQEAAAGRQPFLKTVDLRSEMFVHIVEVLPTVDSQ